MNVRHLVLPAAEEAEPMWTKKLGFRKTSNEQVSGPSIYPGQFGLGEPLSSFGVCIIVKFSAKSKVKKTSRSCFSKEKIIR